MPRSVETSRISARIQGIPPPRIVKPKAFVLPLAQVRPLIRIAHRPVGTLTIPERIIFDYEFVLLVRGAGRLRLRDRDIALGPHHLLAIPPYLPHTFDCHGRCEHIGIHFDFAPDCPRFARTPDRRPPYEVRLAPDLELPLHRVLTPADGVESALIDTVRDWQGGTEATRLAARARIALVVARLVRARGAVDASGPRAAAEDERLRAALEQMRSRFTEPLTMGDCARAAGMSPTRFAHRFREHTGHAPMEYLRHLRVESARRLLADPSLTVKEIAARCGYPDQYHFSRVFHAIDGLAPTQYREAVLAGARSEPV